MITWEARRVGGKMNCPRPIQGPLKLSLTFQFKRPKSHFRTGKNSNLIKESKSCPWHLQKPDDDNLKKAAQDALTASGIWKDDCQVVLSVVAKLWSTGKEGVSIEIEGLE